MCNVVIVAGPPFAGKSTFIKNNFPDYKVIDLYDFQENVAKTPAGIMQSYEMCRDALIEAIKTHEKVVLEHTLLKQIRRPMYIDAIKSVTNAGIDMYFIVPPAQEHLRRAQMRNSKIQANNLTDYYEVMELPTKNEGYNNLYIIREG